MKINIYTSFNGVGLERDFNLLKSVLSGHTVNGLNWVTKQRGMSCDVSIHLEMPRYECIKLAKRNIFIPNPEWFNNSWKRNLSMFDEIWCKTLDCKRIFDQLHKNCIHTGFISEDMYMGDVKRNKLLIHVAGKSMTKGTEAICEAYKKYPELPKCYLISSKNWECTNNLIPCGRIDFSDLKILMNNALIHLCPSSYEGWGHYIHEAFSCGANVLTTDHPPMNEFTAGIPVISKEKMCLAEIGHVSPDAIADEIKRLYSLKESKLIELGKINRENFLRRNSEFTKFVHEQLK